MNKLKVKIEIDPDIDDCEVVIRCSGVSEKVTEIQKLLTKSSPGVSQISLYKDDSEYFIPLESVLFFETEGGSIRAHTANDKFDVKYRLYELVEKLPSYFLRISKSAILNTRRIYSITKNLTGASKIEFQDTYKTVYCSRNYYRALKDMITP